ncbi:hypothetical protein M405DRAFT_879596 [Rhizopogon salebrosus TDB-379]|nr:hypothetical protein M405DRAFT_879596 [Rhizopogon salebrosus TDB-379]
MYSGIILMITIAGYIRLTVSDLASRLLVSISVPLTTSCRTGTLVILVHIRIMFSCAGTFSPSIPSTNSSKLQLQQYPNGYGGPFVAWYWCFNWSNTGRREGASRGLPMAVFSFVNMVTTNGLGSIISGWLELAPNLQSRWRWIQRIQAMSISLPSNHDTYTGATTGSPGFSAQPRNHRKVTSSQTVQT